MWLCMIAFLLGADLGMRLLVGCKIVTVCCRSLPSCRCCFTHHSSGCPAPRHHLGPLVFLMWPSWGVVVCLHSLKDIHLIENSGSTCFPFSICFWEVCSYTCLSFPAVFFFSLFFFKVFPLPLVFFVIIQIRVCWGFFFFFNLCVCFHHIWESISHYV